MKKTLRESLHEAVLENEVNINKIEVAKDKIDYFLGHLRTDKFREDTTIQVRDVYDFLVNLKMELV